MHKIIKLILAVLVFIGVVIVAILALGIYKFDFNHDETATQKAGTFDPKNGTYSIDGQSVTLKNGVSEVEAAHGSASKIITRYFGNEVKHDFDKDGREDSAFLITQETGGSGTFFYVVAALNTANGIVGSHALFLGDRIAPQTTEMGKGDVIVVNYADRKPNESFAVRPSVGKSIWLLLDIKTLQFGEVAQNFEGEADPSRMSLGMKTWNWISTTYGNSKSVKPVDSKKFSITFKKDGTFSASTDCNGVGGNYQVTSNKIVLDRMISTLMYCEGSQEGDFTKMLSGAQTFMFTSRGELVLGLKFDSGSMVLR